MPDPEKRSVTIVGVHHDLARKQSKVRMVWDGDPDKSVVLPIPFGCSLDDMPRESEAALRALSADTATIGVRSIEA
ncbi:hypothetical protein [Lichenifustis flavocetrariae]|uniref:Uncharacterized protein n=1 Tax=Lichenifustis flavocetrariae TaxID=2949735 RepID=A0AA41YVM9_9HYPH|nr:hypothetical protein [Lichenifustis flavocetrariae]MCW6507972.1 hypothetical protein [Lichenifustis flavocetrariae]